MPDREELYRELEEMVAHALATYYEAHPEHEGDERSEHAIKHTYEGLKGFYVILDGYEVRKKP